MKMVQCSYNFDYRNNTISALHKKTLECFLFTLQKQLYPIAICFANRNLKFIRGNSIVNPFVFACITPHGGEIIPDLAGSDPNRMGKTRQSMQKLGACMQSAKPDTIVVLTPHGVRIDGQFSVADCEHMAGSFDENDVWYEMDRPVDRELARTIAQVAKEQNLPVGVVNYATSAGPLSCLPLDWGAIVPLSFMPDVPIVVITPSRLLTMDAHIHFGKALAEAVKASQKRVGLIASCDWSHAHAEDGPYGYDPAAAQLDEQVVKIIQSNHLEEMKQFTPEFIEAAKPDGIWQTMILAGAISLDDRNVEFLSYEAPTYFGLICAAYHTRT